MRVSTTHMAVQNSHRLKSCPDNCMVIQRQNLSFCVSTRAQLHKRLNSSASAQGENHKFRICRDGIHQGVVHRFDEVACKTGLLETPALKFGSLDHHNLDLLDLVLSVMPWTLEKTWC